jgi:glycosyltransferase involved in cell wall biosynthesis
LSYYGGGEKWIINVAKELANRGHDVEVYALPFMLDGKPKINPRKALDDIPYCEAFRHTIKADVVYLTYNPMSWLNFQTSKPRIAGIHTHAYWTPMHIRYGLKPNIANMAHKIAGDFELKRFNAVHMVTNAYSVNHPRVYYVPNFVDAQMYRPIKDKDDVFTIAYSSRMVWSKGWDTFQAVTNALSKQDRFKIKVSQQKVGEENMPEFLSSSHMALLPSVVDTFGLSIVESLLCETPVITTPLVTHKQLGLPLIYDNSVSGFINKVRRIGSLWSENREEYLASARLCRQEALKYDKSVVMEQLENMLMEVQE